MSNNMMGQGLVVEEFRGYQPIIDGRTHDVPVDFVTNNAARENPQARQLHVYAGLGEESIAAQHTMGVLDELGVPASAIVLPFHHLEPTQVNLERVTKEVPIHFARQRNAEAGRPEDQIVDLFGVSQGGGAALMTADEFPEQFGSLAIKAPVGLNSERFGYGLNSTLAKRMDFAARFLINSFHKDLWPVKSDRPFYDMVAIRGVGEILSRVFKDAREGRLKQKIDAALDLQLADNVKRLSQSHPLRIFLGDRDRVFPVHEVAATLGEVGCEGVVEVLPDASHSALTSQAGTQHIQHIANWLLDSRNSDAESST